MPGIANSRIPDNELRQRLEDHNYNVPPITDTTRSILVKKLNQLDQQRKQAAPRKTVYSGLDYSSAEEDFPAPQASSTTVSSRHSSQGDGSLGVRAAATGRARSAGGSATTAGSRTSRSRQGSRRSTPLAQSSRRRPAVASLMTQSEEEGSEEEEEEEDEEVLEEEEEDSEPDEEEEEEENDRRKKQPGADRVDMAIQTSFAGGDSPSSSSSPTVVNSGPRFRGQKVSPSASPYFLSPHLRKNVGNFGSLNEAISTLPPTTSNASPRPHVPATSGESGAATTTLSSSAILTQAVPRPQQQQHQNQSFSGPATVESRFFNSMFISTLIIGFAILFFLFLFVQYVNLKPNQSHQRIPVCVGAEGDRPGVNCIPANQLNDTVKLLGHLLNSLAGELSSCSASNEKGEQPLIHSLKELEDSLNGVETASADRGALLKNLLLLLSLNPAWGVVPRHTENQVTELAVKQTYNGFFCWLSSLLSLGVYFIVQTASYMVTLLLAVALFWLLHKGWKKWTARKAKKRQEVFELVEKVLFMLHQQHQAVHTENKPGPSYLAISHVRDQLIAPPDRQQKAGIWAEVVEYIRHQESRVREEIQHIAGDDFKVWQWLPDIPWSSSPSRSPAPLSSPATPRQPFSPSSPASSVDSPSSSDRQDKFSARSQSPDVSLNSASSPGSPGWQGSAFQLGGRVAAPPAPPTSCLKVRHMFQPGQPMQPGALQEIRREIIERCDSARILHLAVERESTEGVVYIKTNSTADAGQVFRCLHGQWYRGQLVTAKYLRLERYHERFPQARNAEVPLKANN